MPCDASYEKRLTKRAGLIWKLLVILKDDKLQAS